jgi:hypothetical protein
MLHMPKVLHRQPHRALLTPPPHANKMCARKLVHASELHDATSANKEKDNTRQAKQSRRTDDTHAGTSSSIATHVTLPQQA